MARLTPAQMQRSDFVLIDLWSQFDAVRNFVDGWTLERILEWMSFYGHAGTHKTEPFPTLYAFESDFGFRQSFWFDDAKQRLVIPGRRERE